MSRTNSFLRRFAWAVGLVFAAGCSNSDSGGQTPWQIDESSLVPVQGVVKLNGKPIRKALVGFMNSSGIPGVGETGEDGRYVLETANLKGAIPGEYKVTISYLVSPKGEPQGLGARSALQQSADMLAAVEQMPPEYSDLKQTKLSAKVTSEGGTFDFDVPVDLEAPKPKVAGKNGGDSDANVGKQPEPTVAPATKEAAQGDAAKKEAPATQPEK